MGEALRLSDPSDTYISSADIQQTVATLGEGLTERYAGVPELRLITVLNGAVPFARDLKERIDHPNVTTDTIQIGSYRGTQSNGRPKILKYPDKPVEGVHTILVEDLVDTRRTLVKMVGYARLLLPASLEVVAAFEKPVCRLPDMGIPEDVTIGIQIAPHYIVGYGLDLNGDYRGLPHITICDEIAPGQWEPRHLQEPVAA